MLTSINIEAAEDRPTNFQLRGGDVLSYVHVQGSSHRFSEFNRGRNRAGLNDLVVESGLVMLRGKREAVIDTAIQQNSSDDILAPNLSDSSSM
jgi:hypothetical protein